MSLVPAHNFATYLPITAFVEIYCRFCKKKTTKGVVEGRFKVEDSRLKVEGLRLINNFYGVYSDAAVRYSQVVYSTQCIFWQLPLLFAVSAGVVYFFFQY
jgi:hypothetical protein